MALPITDVLNIDVESIENGCATAGEFVKMHCTKRAQTADSMGNTDCAICLDAFADPTGHQLVQTNRKCAHAFHVDCISAHLAVSATCPMCRCEWYVDHPTQALNDWIRNFVNNFDISEHPLKDPRLDPVRKIDADVILPLLSIMVYLVSTRGARSGFGEAAAVLNSEDGHAMVQAMVRFIAKVAGTKDRLSSILMSRLGYGAFNEIRWSGDLRGISSGMMALVLLLGKLAYCTYDVYLAYLDETF